MTDEELREHRHLQQLRAAGIAGANRRSRRRNRKPVNKTQRELQAWLEVRHDKLDEALT